MAGATATIREVKNKDTGIDLTVNNYKETKAMIGSTYEYQCMVVSNLPFFKTAKHKESDNVQFTGKLWPNRFYWQTVQTLIRQLLQDLSDLGLHCLQRKVLKKFNEFEELYTKLNAKFSGTVFPPMPKKVLMMSEAVAKERRAGLDHIVKYIASTPKICTSPLLLEFLGVSAIKAGKFRKMEVSDSIVDKQAQAGESKEKTTETENQTDQKELEEDLFENGAGGPEDQEDDDDDELFAAENVESKTADSTKMFEDQDLSGAFEEGDADDLFLPDAKVDDTGEVPHEELEEENDELFRIEDNLDEIMQLNLKQKAEEKDIDTEPAVKPTDYETVSTEDGVETEVAETEAIPKAPSEESHEVVKPAKPEVKPKPKPRPAARPKPTIKAKPSPSEVNTNNTLASIDSKSSQSETVSQKPVPSPRPKPPLKQKPQLAAKPAVKPKPKPAQASTDNAEASESLGGLPSEDISEDDIMKYIQQNTSADDVDLFS